MMEEGRKREKITLVKADIGMEMNFSTRLCVELSACSATAVHRRLRQSLAPEMALPHEKRTAGDVSVQFGQLAKVQTDFRASKFFS